VGQEPLTAWSPRVDPEVNIESGHLSFMPQEPIDIMNSGKFQRTAWITGITDDEGATIASAFFADETGAKEFEDKFEKYAPLMFGLHDGQSEAPMMMAKKVKDHYFGDKITTYSLVDAISDSSYAHPVEAAAEIHAKNGVKVYLYHFGYRGTNSLAHIKPNEDPPRVWSW
jgi:carboxylesterase type B